VSKYRLVEFDNKKLEVKEHDFDKLYERNNSALNNTKSI